MIAGILAWFAKDAVVKFFAIVWGAITNPIGAALIAATLSGFFFSARESRIVRAEWAAADLAATARNEAARLKRDADIRVLMEKNVKERTDALAARNSILEKKANDYDAYIAKHPAGAWTITPADERGMRDAPVTGKPKPEGGRSFRLFRPAQK
jgi:hypothetical protein